MRILRRVRRREATERGMSVVELVTVVALLGLVLATVYGSLNSASNTVSGTNERLLNLQEARTLMAVASKDVRTAARLTAGTSPFTIAEGNRVEFYANLDTTGAPKKVRISIDTQDRLIEEVWTAGGTAPNYTYTGTPVTRLVGHYVANDAANPLFTYYDDDGDPLSPVPLDAAKRLAVKQVGITLAVKRTSTFNDEVTTVVNRVRLPNLDYSATTG